MTGQTPVDTSATKIKGLLARLPLFAGLTDRPLEALLKRIRPRRFNRGSVIFYQGDPGNLLYIILTGAVKITVPSAVGKELVLSVLGPGDFFGELSLFDGEPRSATAESIEDTHTLVLSRDDFLALVQENPQMAVHILMLLSRRLRGTNILAQDACLLDLPGRLARRLMELADRYGKKEGKEIAISVRLTQAELAALVGATRVATNRQLHRMRELGLIAWSMQHITVRDPDALRELATG